MNITVDTTSKINKETLKTNISNSLIVRALVSDTISDSIEKDIKEIYDELTISNGTKVIKSEELNSLVDVLALNSIDNTITLNANIDINSYTIVKNDIATLRNSKIVSYKLTKEIENMGICGDDKKLPAASYSKEDGYISEDELNYLFDIVSIDNKLSIAKLKNSTYTSIDKNKIEPFKNSTIVRYKISSFLPGNDIVIPDEVYETDSNNKKLIISDEYQKLIDALVSLGLTDSTSFDISNIDNNFDDIKATKVANSIILRATITEKLEITNEEISLYYFSGDIDSTKTVNGKQILILTNDEVKNILIGITSMGIENGVSISISIDTIKKYTEDTLTTVLKSNTLRYILSQVVSTVSTTAPTNNEYVYLKNNNKLDYISFYTSDEIKSEVKNLQK